MNKRLMLASILVGLLALTGAAGWLYADSQQRLVLALRADLSQTKTALDQQVAATRAAQLDAGRMVVDLRYARQTIEVQAKELAARPAQVRDCFQGLLVRPLGDGLIQLPLEVCGWNLVWDSWTPSP